MEADPISDNKATLTLRLYCEVWNVRVCVEGVDSGVESLISDIGQEGQGCYRSLTTRPRSRSDCIARCESVGVWKVWTEVWVGKADPISDSKTKLTLRLY